MGNDALLHKTQEENDKLRRERTSYKLDKEAYRGTIDKLKEELDDEKKFNEWLKYFSGYIYRKDKDMYDKASNSAYELLTINIKGEEGDERRKEILEQESKQTTSGKKNSKS